MRTFDEFKKGKEKHIFDAVWQYLMDHADVTREGVYFVKFHTDSKEKFANHIRARMKGVYRNSLDEMSGLAERRRAEQQGLKEKHKKIKAQKASNLKELQKFKTPPPIRKKWWQKLIPSLFA